MTTVEEDRPKFGGISGDYARVTGIEDLVLISAIDPTAEDTVTIAMTPDQARSLAAGIVAAADNAEAHQSAPDAVARLVEAARAGLNYLENTEGEFGITLGSATGLRAALAAMEASDDRALCDAYEYSRLAVAHANNHADTAISDMQELRAEIERLTKERQAFEGMAKDNYFRLQKAEAERDEARAEQAVLLERAAGRMDAGFSYNAGNCVRGVIPDDALEAQAEENRRLRTALTKINLGDGWAAQIARAALALKGGE